MKKLTIIIAGLALGVFYACGSNDGGGNKSKNDGGADIKKACADQGGNYSASMCTKGSLSCNAVELFDGLCTLSADFDCVSKEQYARPGFKCADGSKQYLIDATDDNNSGCAIIKSGASGFADNPDGVELENAYAFCLAASSEGSGVSDLCTAGGGEIKGPVYDVKGNGSFASYCNDDKEPYGDENDPLEGGLMAIKCGCSDGNLWNGIQCVDVKDGKCLFSKD